MIKYVIDKISSQVIDALSKECIPCRNWAEQVRYLETQLDLARAAAKDERDEYKRTVDRLLELSGSKAIGQGQTQQNIPYNPADLINIFKEKDEGNA